MSAEPLHIVTGQKALSPEQSAAVRAIWAEKAKTDPEITRQMNIDDATRAKGNGEAADAHCPWCCDDDFHHRYGKECSNCRGKYMKTRTCEAHRDRQPILDAVARLHAVTSEDFWAYMPMHTYIYAPSREMWPASSVNARLPSVPTTLRRKDGSAVTVKPSDWLDKHRAVEQMTWWPGKPEVIPDVIFASGTLLPRQGNRVFNLYRPPKITHGDPAQAERWLELVRRIYPREWEHIVAWLAHRVQRPDEKVNHALVLGGAPGIGKDSLLDPVRAAVGEWNFSEVRPASVMGRFNGFVKAVVLRISEARDLGEVSRFDFYEYMKTYIASPPEVLRCDEKNIHEYEVPNLVGVLMTTNHRTSGIYLPPDDRRHFVAWSELRREDIADGFWAAYYGWLDAGGRAHVVAYLAGRELAGFDPKAEPPKTDAFWAIVSANMTPEDADMAEAIAALGTPDALILSDILDCPNVSPEFRDWLRDRKNARKVAHRLEEAGFVAVHCKGVKDGRWRVGARSVVVYARRERDVRDRVIAAQKRVSEERCVWDERHGEEM